MRILVVAVICAVVVRGNEASSTTQAPIQPSGAPSIFHYTCTETNGRRTYTITMNDTTKQYIVTQNHHEDLGSTPSPNDCYYKWTNQTDQTITVNGCNKSAVYLYEFRTSGNASFIGGNLLVYNLSCGVYEKAKYHVTSEIEKVKEEKPKTSEMDNPDLNLVMGLNSTDVSIGEPIMVTVNDYTKGAQADTDYLEFVKCAAVDPKTHSIELLGQNGAIIEEKIIISVQNNINAKMANFTMTAFRFVESDKVTITCDLLVCNGKCTETTLGHRRRRASDVDSQRQQVATVQASYTIKSESTQSSTGTDVSASAVFTTLVGMVAALLMPKRY